jgi:septum formation protein
VGQSGAGAHIGPGDWGRVYHPAVRLVLASASPRRADLLRAAGLPFVVDPVEIDESPLGGEAPGAYVERLAFAKTRAGIRRNPGSVVLGADTTVVLDGQILAKPDGRDGARKMLEMLSGRTHCVLTGVAVSDGERELGEVVSTQVRFLPLSRAGIEWYLATGEPEGKAGAYAIQGRASRFIDWIEGSYPNVVGLPVATVCQLLDRLAGRPAGAAGSGS